MEHQKNFSWLFFALIVFMVGVPVADELELLSPRIIDALLTSWVLIVGVWSLRGFGKYFVAAIILAATGVILNSISTLVESNLVVLAASVATAGFVLLAVRCIFVQVASVRSVDLNRLVGAISLYLLLGILWTIAYSTVELIDPGSISNLSAESAGGQLSELIYFSFVTMTTLGYGDIVPVSPIARSLAYIQAVFGQFYVAILVAGLVSAYISGRDGS